MKQGQRIKRITAALALGLVLTGGNVWADEAIPLRRVEGTSAVLFSGSVETDLAETPLLFHDTVYVPLRSLLNALSPQTTEIIWREDRTVTLKTSFKNGRGQTVQATIYMGIDNPACEITKITADTGESESVYSVQLHNRLTLATPPILEDSKTYIPINLLSALNREVALTEGVTLVMDSDEAMLKKTELARVWAEALKTRDGKPRYDMMTETLQKEFLQEKAEAYGENLNYVIGVSSPWTVSYDIHMQGDMAYITYYQTDSTGERTELNESLMFTETDNGWKVSGSEYQAVTE